VRRSSRHIAKWQPTLDRIGEQSPSYFFTTKNRSFEKQSFIGGATWQKNDFPKNMFSDFGYDFEISTHEQMAIFTKFLKSKADDRDIEMLLMRYKEGMTFKQIAEIKEISPQYAHKRISKIVRKMKEWRFYIQRYCE